MVTCLIEIKCGFHIVNSILIEFRLCFQFFAVIEARNDIWATRLIGSEVFSVGRSIRNFVQLTPSLTTLICVGCVLFVGF